MAVQLLRGFFILSTFALSSVSISLLIIQSQEHANMYHLPQPPVQTPKTSLPPINVLSSTKYILSIGYHAQKGATMFKDCSIKDCHFTENQSFFGSGHEHRFDAVIIAPMNFRKDQVRNMFLTKKEIASGFAEIGAPYFTRTGVPRRHLCGAAGKSVRRAFERARVSPVALRVGW